MTRSKVACLALVTAAALAPVAVVKSQSTATAVEPLVDFGDPLLAPLVRRGPVNSDELGRAVRAYLAQGLDEEAAQIIAAYLDPRERSSPLPGENISVEPATACGYCVEQLAFGESPAQAAQELKAVLAALESLEHKAHATRDGDLFVGLAVALEKEPRARSSCSSRSPSRGVPAIWKFSSLPIRCSTSRRSRSPDSSAMRRGWSTARQWPSKASGTGLPLSRQRRVDVPCRGSRAAASSVGCLLGYAAR